MRGYVIFEIEITNAERYEDYKKMVPPTVEKFGGKFVVRGGSVMPLEGGWAPKRLGIIEFSSVEQARAWYDSPEYAPAKKLRQETARSRLLIVEGI
jgi:uncharacterized protein (DUF1330 family)